MSDASAIRRFESLRAILKTDFNMDLTCDGDHYQHGLFILKDAAGASVFDNKFVESLDVVDGIVLGLRYAAILGLRYAARETSNVSMEMPNVRVEDAAKKEGRNGKKGKKRR